MKLFLVLFAVASSSFAGVSVLSANFNTLNGTIAARLQYGGCRPPKFKLNFDNVCYETTIPQAEAKVVQIAGDDGCERLNVAVVNFSLQGDPCLPYGRHFVNLNGSHGNSVSVSVDRTLE